MIRSILRSRPTTSAILSAFAACALSEESKSPCASCSSCGSTYVESTIQFRRLFPLKTEALNQSNNTSLSREEETQSLHNSALLIHNVLSTEECEVLRNEADYLLNDGVNSTYRRDRYSEEDDQDDEDEDVSLRRVSICDMSPAAQELANRIIKERVLPTMQRQTPHLLDELEGWDDVDANFEWASDEPSVNRYTVGGQFEPHRDGYPLTIVVLLSKGGDFDGGGTEFFETKPTLTNISEADGVKSVVLHPTQGTALCFNGDITHAGSPVISGTRHVFVASFGIK